MTKQQTQQQTQQVGSDALIDERADVRRLSALHFAHRCLGRYLEARTNRGDATLGAPGDPATDAAVEAVVQQFGNSVRFGTWLMKLGADVHADALEVSAPVWQWRVRSSVTVAPSGSEGTT